MISRRPSMKPIIWVTIFSTRKAVKDVMPAGVACWAHLGVPSLGLDPLVFFRFARSTRHQKCPMQAFFFFDKVPCILVYLYLFNGSSMWYVVSILYVSTTRCAAAILFEQFI